jgi:alpha-beta hydrolase superfamily lysophospholipase
MTEFRFTSTDGLSIVCKRWDAPAPIKGIVQIAHGMGEHIGRYVQLIDVLQLAGFSVYANDHRGHGATAPSREHLGDFGPGGFDLLVEDMFRLTTIAKTRNPEAPFILLGHSMGSFAAQQYAIDHSFEIDGLALSGSGALDSLAALWASSAGQGNILNARFEPARTPFDWLSRDPAVADAFMADPLCFAQLQPASLASFLAAGHRLASEVELRKICTALPVYLFSGSEDPVGMQLEGVRILERRYRAAGVRNVSHDFYEGGRHEMLNETNRDEVRARLLGWIKTTADLACGAGPLARGRPPGRPMPRASIGHW